MARGAEINTHPVGKGQFNEERDQSMGKGQSLSTNDVGKTGYPHMKKNEIECLS